MLHANKFRFSAPAISKTTAPEWANVFNVPLKRWATLPMITVVIWTKERFKKHYLGELEIPLKELFKNQRFGLDDPNNQVCLPLILLLFLLLLLLVLLLLSLP